MRFNRNTLLDTLQSVMPGIATKAMLEQSGCFIFEAEEVVSFNDEIACRTPLQLGFTGAVQASQLMSFLDKMSDEIIEIRQKDNEIIIQGQTSGKAGFRLENEITLPLSGLEFAEWWEPLPVNFADAVSVVYQSAGSDENKFALTCVHLTSDFVEACDMDQMCRFPIQLNLEQPILIPQASIKHVIGLAMTHYSYTKSWMHFCNAAGLILSCRKYTDMYPDMGAVLDNSDGNRIVLPGNLAEHVKRAEVFSSENTSGNKVVVDLSPGKMIVTGTGVSGWFEKRFEVDYDGAPLRFAAPPKMLVQLCSRHNECSMNDHCIKVDTGLFVFVTSVETTQT